MRQVVEERGALRLRELPPPLAEAEGQGGTEGMMVDISEINPKFLAACGRAVGSTT